MSVIKSFAVGNGDMFYISHESGTFTVIDCDLSDQNAATIIDEIKTQSASRSIYRFICTHPDEDHFGGLHLLDDAWPISNFYVVKNQAIKDKDTDSFKRYCQLRDDAKKAFYISKGCVRKWLNQGDDSRGSSGISVLWPDLDNVRFKEALAACEAGESYNNTSAVLRYSIGNTSVMWLGDLETGFDLPPVFRANLILVESVSQEDGHEEAIHRRADHRLPEAGGRRHAGQGALPQARLQ